MNGALVNGALVNGALVNGAPAAENAAAAPTVVLTRPELPDCSGCGAHVDPDARFCSACGAARH